MDVLARFKRTRKLTRTIAVKNGISHKEGIPVCNGYYLRQSYDKTEIVKELRFNIEGSREDFDAGMLERMISKCDSILDKSLPYNKKAGRLDAPEKVKLLINRNYSAFDY